MNSLSIPLRTDARLLSIESRSAPDISIVVPTYNERDNVAAFVESIRVALAGCDWEAIFVDDDSPDDTHAYARSLAMADHRVRCIRRIGRRGLASAVIEGILSSSSHFVAVMDGDLQHDEACLPRMLAILKSDCADLVVASRYVGEGDCKGLDGRVRWAKSHLGNWLAHRVLKHNIADPMSGFFMMRRDLFEHYAGQLSHKGFKILLSFLMSADPGLRVVEVPMVFRERRFGVSKLDLAAELAFVALLYDRTIGLVIPARFCLFALVGGSGVVVHLAVLKLVLSLGSAFAISQGAAALTAMTSNFLINNATTFSDRRLTGWRCVGGLLSFAGVCSLGLIANVGVGHVLFGEHYSWWLSGIAGATVGAVWNYSMASIVTWRSPS